MLKILAILALFIFAFPMQAYSQPDKAQQPSKSDKPSPPVTPVPQQQIDGPPLQGESKNHIDADVRVTLTPDKDGYEIAGFWVSVALAVIALGGVIYARKTLIAIQGQLAEIKAAGVQTDQMLVHAGKQADAVLQQSDIAKNAQRAWMIPRISEPEFDEVMSTAGKGDNWLLPIEVKFTNRGQTPATALRGLTEVTSEITIDPKAMNLVLALPETLTYTTEPANYAPGAVYVTGDTTSFFRAIPNSFLIRENAAWRSGEKCLCVKGFIEYRDAFNETHISRFCYAFQTLVEGGGLQYALTGKPVVKPGFRKAGPDIYNEIT